MTEHRLQTTSSAAIIQIDRPLCVAALDSEVMQAFAAISAEDMAHDSATRKDLETVLRLADGLPVGCRVELHGDWDVAGQGSRHQVYRVWPEVHPPADLGLPVYVISIKVQRDHTGEMQRCFCVFADYQDPDSNVPYSDGPFRGFDMGSDVLTNMTDAMMAIEGDMIARLASVGFAAFALDEMAA